MTKKFVLLAAVVALGACAGEKKEEMAPAAEAPAAAPAPAADSAAPAAPATDSAAAPADTTKKM